MKKKTKIKKKKKGARQGMNDDQQLPKKISFFFFFKLDWGLNSGLHACKAVLHLLSHTYNPFCSGYFGDRVF
jgi:hypothetical protein